MAINAWWAEQATQRYWMEITDRDDPGVNLTAPQFNGAGRDEWSYRLVTYAAPGDIVLHWHKTLAGRPALIGWSEVLGPLATGTMDWLARGSRGRARGLASEVPTWTTELGGLNELPVPIALDQLNPHRDEILRAIARTADENPGSIYAPFYDYGGRTLRAMQAYLVKMPTQVLQVLARIADLSQVPGVETRGRHPRVKGGQGRQQDPALRKAVEVHAVELAKTHYRSLGATRIKELGKPYDLNVLLDGAERHVEVKGATADKVVSVTLTAGEVDHASTWPTTDLFVVDGIRYREVAAGRYETSGGSARVWPSWRPDIRALKPTEYRYALPDSDRADDTH